MQRPDARLSSATIVIPPGLRSASRRSRAIQPWGSSLRAARLRPSPFFAALPLSAVRSPSASPCAASSSRAGTRSTGSCSVRTRASSRFRAFITTASRGASPTIASTARDTTPPSEGTAEESSSFHASVMRSIRAIASRSAMTRACTSRRSTAAGSAPRPCGRAAMRARPPSAWTTRAPGGPPEAGPADLDRRLMREAL